MSLIRKHGAVLQAWACLDLVFHKYVVESPNETQKMDKTTDKILQSLNNHLQ